MTDSWAGPLSPMVRSAIFVADLERSSKFYRQVLQLDEVFFEGELSDGNAHLLLGMPAGMTTRALILKAPGPAWGMVGLFELTDPAPQPLERRDHDAANIGETCLVFYCADLDPVLAALRAGGHTVLCPPTPLVIGDFVKQREMTFRDPDGIMINLIEWDPSAAVRPETRRPAD